MGRKVLFTASTFSHILNFHLPYLQAFQEEGWTVHVACGGSPAAVPFSDDVFVLPFEKSMWSARNFGAAAILRERIKSEKYDLVSTHTSLAAFFTRLAFAGLKHRPPVANVVHGYLFDSDTPYLKRQLLLGAERRMAPQTDLLLTMNQWDFDAAKQYRLGRKVVHIPGIGIDLSRFIAANKANGRALREEWGIPDGAAVLIYAAEFSKRKSQSVLIRAMENLPDDTVLVLAGDGVLRKDCQKLAEDLRLESRIIFPGYIRDMVPWYHAADIAVASSRSEGLPFNIMEAMYSELPVVASDVKGHNDLISDGETGLLYPYGDADACAAQILRLLESETLRNTITAHGRNAVAQYDIHKVFPVVMAQYSSLAMEEVEA